MNRKSIIITGASRGLGRAVALKFGREGWAVVVNYNASKSSADEVVAEITRSGGAGIAVKADVRIYSEVEAMINETISRFRPHRCVDKQCRDRNGRTDAEAV